jgi:hypothetical protein
MRGLLVVAFALALVGCEQRKPAVSDADFAAFRESNPGMTKQCLDAFRYGGIMAWRPDDPDCYAMLPAQRWSGIWILGFEWTNFCPDPATDCSVYGEPGVSWVTFAGGAYPWTKSPPDGSYHIEFVGRRTKDAGHFGHLGQYDHLVVVDKVISIRRMPERAERSNK